MGSVCGGILSGLIASFIFFLAMNFVKPKLCVSDNINLADEIDGERTYKVKVVNKSYAHLTNVVYKLCYCTLHENGVLVDLIELPPAKTPIFMVHRYSPKRGFAEYAVQLSYKVDNGKYPIDDRHYLMFSISAEHSVSNSLKSITKKFRVCNVKKGQFETGKSMTIV